MKAPAFDHVRPSSIDEVLQLMQTHGDDARILAGGQTLLATLGMRLSEPRLLIDIGGIAALRGIRVDADRLHIGALTTHSMVEASPLVAAHAPLLAQAAPHIAHRAIRNRGTFGGSIAFADPSAEWPACLLALEGSVVLQGPAGIRRVVASEFFLDLYTTARQDDELLIGCELPLRRDHDVNVFLELARRKGDYAIVGLALAGRIERGVMHQPRLAFLGIGSTPLRSTAAEAVLDGRPLDEALIASAIAALRAELEPYGDLCNGPDTKRHLAAVLAERALRSVLGSQAAVGATP